MKATLLFRYGRQTLTFILILSGFFIQAQMLPNQSVEIKYDARGNRILRQVWDGSDPPQTKTEKPSSRTATNAMKEIGVTVFPNPTRSNLTVALEAPDSTLTEISVLNTTGQVCIKEFMQPGSLSINIALQDLPAGMYYLRAVSDHRKYSLPIVIY